MKPLFRQNPRAVDRASTRGEPGFRGRAMSVVLRHDRRRGGETMAPVIVPARRSRIPAAGADDPLAFGGPLPYNAAFREPPGQQACRGGF